MLACCAPHIHASLVTPCIRPPTRYVQAWCESLAMYTLGSRWWLKMLAEPFAHNASTHGRAARCFRAWSHHRHGSRRRPVCQDRSNGDQRQRQASDDARCQPDCGKGQNAQEVERCTKVWVGTARGASQGGGIYSDIYPTILQLLIATASDFLWIARSSQVLD